MVDGRLTGVAIFTGFTVLEKKKKNAVDFSSQPI
jgi:hypothetical protein